MPELISNDGGLELWRSGHARPEFIEQIAATAFGSSGLRYRRLDVDRQVGRLKDTSFFELREAGRLVATYAVSRTPLRVRERRIDGQYRGLLTVAPSRQSAGLGRQIVSRTLAFLRETEPDGARLSWGCIDRNNKPSIALLESLGAVRLGTLSTRLVYRQFPRRVDSSAEITDDALVSRELRSAYADCLLYSSASPETSARPPMTGVASDDSIAAAARAEVVRLDLASVGNPWYARYGKLIDLLPPARKRFDPRDFRYLRLSDVIAKPGRGQLWRTLLGDLLRRHDVHMAMFCLDERGQVFDTLAAAGLFGRLADATRQHVDVLGLADGLADDELLSIGDAPLALQAFDL